jgi:uncharacterized protein YggE
VERHITVNGTGTVSAAPDRCQLDVRVGVTSDSVREATDAMAVSARDVIAALREAGAVEVSTGRLLIRQEQDNKGNPRGFRSETGIRAELDISAASGEAVSALIEAAVVAGGDRLSIDGIGFAHSDPTAQEHQALREAVAAARARAGVAAEAAGVAVSRVVNIEQAAHLASGPIRYRAVQMEMADVPVEPGAQTTTVEVKATYEIS